MAFHLPTYDLRQGSNFTLCPMRCPLCRSFEEIMPAIAPIEDLRTAQEDFLAVRDLEELKRVFKKWAALDGKTSASCGLKKALQRN